MSGRRDNRFAARIDIEHLRFAVAAAEFGSFHKAAEALNVQQSTLLVDPVQAIVWRRGRFDLRRGICANGASRSRADQ